MASSSSNLSNTAKSVVIAHHHTLIREGIVRILQEGGFQVTGQAETGQNLKNLVAEHQPDIALVDWEVSEVDAGAIHELAEGNQYLTVVILARPQSADSSLPAVQAGAKGCLSVNLSPQEFLQSLRLLVQGDLVVSRDIAEGFEKGLTDGEMHGIEDSLSGREREVICLVGQGQSNREIAEKLIVSEHTIKVHLRHIMNKLTLRNRQQIAAYAAREGLVSNINPYETSDHTS
jgi:DNA-binding NarL/FixJ family response regulator